MSIPKYEQWMKDTYSLTAKRSPLLLALDEAIKKPGAKDADVKAALDRWIEDQIDAGKDWRKSVRNSKGAVTSLYRYLNDNRKLAEQELEAMAYIARQQKAALAKQFSGKKVKLKWEGKDLLAGGSRGKLATAKSLAMASHGAYSTAKSTLENVQKIGDKAAAAKDVADINGKIVEFCGKLCKHVDVNEVLSMLGLGNVQSFAADLAPLVGLLSSGGKALAGWAKVAEAAWRQQGIAGARYAVAPGDPEAAFDAILVLLTREVKSKTGRAGTATVAFTGKALGAVLDAGAVTGPLMAVLETLAGIFQDIVECARDCHERNTANDLLNLGALNLELFNMCPLLGCYYLVVQDHSTIINIAVGEYGGPNFVFDAERMIAKVRPVLEQARAYIQASRLEIADLEKAKGIAVENWHVKGKLGKLADLPNHVVEVIGTGIIEKLSKPDDVPLVDKSRIIGYDYMHSRDRANAVSLAPTRARANAVASR
jgi:hypothetical protein